MLRLGHLIFSVLLIAMFSHGALASNDFVSRPEVQQFIQDMVKKHKFKKQELVKLFETVKVRPQVMRHISKPLEKEPWHIYQMLFVSEWRIQHGVLFWNKYKSTLARAEKIYGVPASVIVATIGIETKYGQRTGTWRVIDALTNIGFSNSKRAAFFRKELEEFLLLTREQKLDPLKVLGSYAGAIGQPQFMPSSYRNYAVNFSKSGKIDLMNDEVDIIGSIANYYQKNGWTPNQPIVAPAMILGDRYHYLMRKNKIDQPLSLTEWARYGVITKQKNIQESTKVKVIELQNHYSKEYWLGFHNFDVIRRYNASDLYVMAVYQLSSYITELRNRLPNE